MTDGKFTDDEIIKVLECCGKGDCENCNHDWSYSAQWDCMRHIERLALDLINRQKAEIERLTDLINEIAEANEDLVRDNHDLYVSLKKRDAEIERFADIGKMYSEVRAEAIREFAERFKERCGTNCDSAIIWAKGTIDNLVKEMTEK